VPAPESLAPSPRDLNHRQAVDIYERGLEALQRHEYGRAAELLQGVLARFPEEKELLERVRLYLNVCERQTLPRDATPRTAEERVYAATLAINAGAYETGLAQLEALAQESPRDDHVHYMLTVVHTLRRDLIAALACLQRAVELNPENRLLASQDADLEALRQHPRFRSVVGAGGRRERREAFRLRSTR
jgi:tetratricopeptide (TPR) repeat protein